MRDDVVYPRGCGGTTDDRQVHLCRSGLSPRVRGDRLPATLESIIAGSIPAGAGGPKDRNSTNPHKMVYPRGCGETTGTVSQVLTELGLSPRVRGDRLPATLESIIAGSIPAGAGGPKDRNSTNPHKMVYPRGCGETTGTVSQVLTELGLSPRVRGDRLQRVARRNSERSIPAGAGGPTLT